MKRNLKEFKVSQNLAEATASKTDLQFIRAKTARNDHFETRRYIADKLLNDKDLAMAYKSLDMIHSKYNSMVGNDMVELLLLRLQMERRCKRASPGLRYR